MAARKRTVHSYEVMMQGSEAERAKPADPVPGDNGAALLRIVEYFKAEHPAAWDALRLCPLQHGVDAMAEVLKA